jgi:hypothetical protein
VAESYRPSRRTIRDDIDIPRHGLESGSPRPDYPDERGGDLGWIAAPFDRLGHCVMRMTCPPPAEVGLTLPLET